MNGQGLADVPCPVVAVRDLTRVVQGPLDGGFEQIASRADNGREYPLPRRRQ